MKRAGVPVLPGSEGKGVTEVRDALADAKQLGFPVLIKAAAGGGGKGMRVARDAQELTRLFPLARSESEAAFGSRTMYLEKYLSRARHVEFQILADNNRNIVHLGERDCSIQRRHQKVLEEAPCPVLTPKLREKMGKAAVRAAQVVGYSNVGTVEFLLAPDGQFYFIEMNTRIQVEHGVTEMVTSTDLVKESIRIATGDPLGFKQRRVEFEGSAIECRVYAEDPDTQLPSPGVVTNHHPPGGLGVRVETALYDGYRVPIHYDPLIAKVIAHADDRKLAIARAKAALREYLIDGIKTNIPLHLKILDDADFQSGQFATDFLRRYEPVERTIVPERLAARAS
jgi:acetyl-CoA carboxylase biotin carboxylase subunit